MSDSATHLVAYIVGVLGGIPIGFILFRWDNKRRYELFKAEWTSLSKTERTWYITDMISKLNSKGEE